MPTLNRRHFKQIANAIRDSFASIYRDCQTERQLRFVNKAHKQQAHHMAVILSGYNSNFQYDKFIQETGADDYSASVNHS